MDKIGNILSKASFGKIDSWQKRMGGFTMVQNSLISTEKLNIYEKMILIVLEFHKIKKNTCWPSQQTIAKKSGCSVTTVKKFIKQLEAKNLIIKIPNKKRRSTEYSSTTNIYTASGD